MDEMTLLTTEMTLRDWLAGQALASISSNNVVDMWTANQVARSVYLIADAMLDERKRESNHVYHH